MCALSGVFGMCYTINEIKSKVTPIGQMYGVKSISLFGSYAKGSADDDSDVDLYIEKGNICGLLDYFSFVNDLEESLKCHVDVVTTEMEDVAFLGEIKKDRGYCLKTNYQGDEKYSRS